MLNKVHPSLHLNVLMQKLRNLSAQAVFQHFDIYDSSCLQTIVSQLFSLVDNSANRKSGFKFCESSQNLNLDFWWERAQVAWDLLTGLFEAREFTCGFACGEACFNRSLRLPLVSLRWRYLKVQSIVWDEKQRQTRMESRQPYLFSYFSRSLRQLFLDTAKSTTIRNVFS